MLGALPFYFAFFKQQKVYVIRTIHIVILIHCLIGLYQWYMMWTGNTEMAMLFNNYPSQENYVYPEALPETGLYRFSGLFGESSQLSILLSFYYIFFKTYEKGKYQNYFTSLVVFTMIIVNVSLSGYLMIFFYLFFNMVTKEIGIEIHKNNIFLLGFVVIILILFIINGDIENNIGKLTRFVFSRINLDDSSVRMDAFKDKLMVFMEYPFLGKGISWGDTATWDYLSYYLSGYGVLGFLTVSLSILYVVLGSNFNYYVVLGVAFLSNGVILAPFYIIIFSLISLDNKIRNQYQYIKNIKNTNLPLKSSILKP